MPRPPERDWRRAAKLRFGGAALLFVAGAVMAAVGDGAVDVAAVVVMGVAVVLAVSFLFLEVGLSEDRERERKRR